MDDSGLDDLWPLTAPVDFARPLFDLAAVQRVNPQRGLMSYLSGVLALDAATHRIAGWFDVPVTQECGVPPLSPLFALCESVAQLSGFYARSERLFATMTGLGGLDAVEGPADACPGDRIILRTCLIRGRQGRFATFRSSAAIGERLVLRATLLIVPLRAK